MNKLKNKDIINNAMLSYGVNPQDIIKQHITNDKIAHAYLLAGPSECMNEKECFVADVAHILNVLPANHLVVGKNEDAITIDMMRDIKTITASSAGNTPRVVMIYNADCFTTQAANAFLKTLEEPPSRTIFFLLASSRAGILPTLLSRVWTVRFSSTSVAQHSMSDRSQSLNVGRRNMSNRSQSLNVANSTFNVCPEDAANEKIRKRSENDTRNEYATLNVELAQTFFQLPLAERYAINEKLAKLDDHGKQFVADLITHLRYETKNGIKKPAFAMMASAGKTEDILPHAVEAYELLHLPGAPYRLILDTLATVSS